MFLIDYKYFDIYNLYFDIIIEKRGSKVFNESGLAKGITSGINHFYVP